jgi:hypothetical protein
MKTYAQWVTKVAQDNLDSYLMGDELFFCLPPGWEIALWIYDVTEEQARRDTKQVFTHLSKGKG